MAHFAENVIWEAESEHILMQMMHEFAKRQRQWKPYLEFWEEEDEENMDEPDDIEMQLNFNMDLNDESEMDNHKRKLTTEYQTHDDSEAQYQEQSRYKKTRTR